MKRYFKHLPAFILVLFSFLSSSAQDSFTPKEKAIAEASMANIEQKGRWVNQFSNQDLVELPIGVRTTLDHIQYSIGVTKATFFPEYTLLTVFCRIDLPQKDAQGQPIQLFFGADDVKLSHEGGIIGDAKLVLLGNVDIPLNANKWQLSLYGGFDMATGVMQDLTYATIDCNGFKEMSVSGAVEFARDLILPIDPISGKVEETKLTVPKTFYNGRVKQVPNRVKGEFHFLTTNWNDILVDVSLQPFVLKDKRNGKDFDGNFEFLVTNAVLDLSDLHNNPSVSFPDYYTQNGLLLPEPNAWRGVYVQNFNVGLPKEFKTSDTASNNQRIYIGAQNLIIDKYGVSGIFYADNVFPLDKGITSDEKSWAYSLDHIDVTIAANTFVKANINGEILLPITKHKPDSESTSGSDSTSKKRTGLLYSGFISMHEQQLAVVSKDSISFDLWKAKAVLLPNSLVELKLVDGKFLPKAILNGALSIGANKDTTDGEDGTGKKTVDFKGITFQNLQLQTVSPVISVGSMGYNGMVSFNNFPVSIGNINVQIMGNDTRIDFDLGLNLMDAVGASATARIGIKSKMYEEGPRQKCRYDGLDLSAISIDATIGLMKMKGALVLMENDPLYGNGFNAELEVEIKELLNIKAKATFGRSTFRYWYFDAAAESLNAVGIIKGFGGGGYYKMRKLATLEERGYSPSGLVYVPDEKVGLGVKALVSFVIGQEKICNGYAALEIAFNSSGGVNFVALYGQAKVADISIPGTESIKKAMEDVMKNVTSKTSFLGVDDAILNTSFAKRFLPKAEAIMPTDVSLLADITAELALEFDFTNKSTHGDLSVYINTPGNFISGTGNRGRAGNAVFHKDPANWYLYLGTPEQRMGVKMGIAGVYCNTGAYLMTGSLLPASPPPPPAVARILGQDAVSLNYMRDENMLANGGGFAFGSNLDFNTGDLNFLLFYAHFQAGMGFDMMLKDYGDAHCSNTGKQVGINGWYANGQAYAYLQGELGVNVRLSFLRLKVPLISGAAAVLLQAKLPNPVWARGYLAGDMNVLGGVIKGKFRFKLTVGEECVLEQDSPLGGLKLITDLTPKTGSGDVDVFAIPQATFSLKVNEAFVIPEDQGDTTYKILLEQFKVFDGTTEIPGKIEWDSSKDRANFVSTDILPPYKPLKVRVEVSFLKMVNGIFQAVTVDGKVAKETEEREFTTGGAPNHIPLNNIQYSYPVVEQKYFFEDEYPKAYIQLRRGQDYLFDDSVWKTEIRTQERESSNTTTSTFSYTNDNEIIFDLPNINQQKKYDLAILSTLKSGAQAPAGQAVKTTIINNDGNDIQISENQAIDLSKDGEINRLTYCFSVSKYKTFTAKMNSITTKYYNFGIIYSDVVYLSNLVSSQEAFDLADLIGTGYSDNTPLILAQAALNDDYYRSDIYPQLYQNYPLDGKYYITRRDTGELGLPPAKAISFNATYIARLENDLTESWMKEGFPYKYNLPLLYKQDWTDLYNQITGDYIRGLIPNGSRARQFMDADYPSIRYGFYDVLLKYSLPGNKKAVEYTYKFKNNIK